MAWKGNLLAAGGNAKTVKGDKRGQYVTAILYLSPSDASGFNVCPMAKLAMCEAPCLNTAGRGAMNSVQRARLRKTLLFFSDREKFLSLLVDDIRRFKNWCEKKGVFPAIRLNGTSDISWETIPVEGYSNIFEMFSSVVFYDYTKIAKRVKKTLPDNYSLTLSYSGANSRYAEMCRDAYDAGANLAVVFRTREMLENAIAHGWEGRTVVDGDETDLRFLDPENVVVGLYAKGKARRDRSGFVVG